MGFWGFGVLIDKGVDFLLNVNSLDKKEYEFDLRREMSMV